MTPRNYARLHFAWYRDPVLEAIADEDPAAVWAWPLLVSMAKEASHATTNPTGEVECAPGRVARALHLDADRVRAVLDLLAEGELVTLLEPSSPRLVRFRLTSFDRWQTPRSGSAEREQARRDRGTASREKASERDAGVSGSLRSVGRETGNGIPETGENKDLPTVDPRPNRRRRVAVATDDELEQAIAGHRARMDGAAPGLGGLVAALVEVLAAENRSGKVALSRAARVLWQPIAEMLDDLPADAVRYGVEQALAADNGRGVPNANYVRKAAAKRAEGADPRSTNRTRGNHADDRTAPGCGPGTYSRPTHVF